MKHTKKDFLVFCGPSGVGKTTLIHHLMTVHPDEYAFSVSHTTRERRKGEVNGVDYWFISKQEMIQKIQQNSFIEYAKVHGNYYGTSHQAVQEIILRNKKCILDVDTQGVQSIMRQSIPATFILLLPPSIEFLAQRLVKRNSETQHDLYVRIQDSKREIEVAKTLSFDFTILYDTLQNAYPQLENYIYAKCQR